MFGISIMICELFIPIFSFVVLQPQSTMLQFNYCNTKCINMYDEFFIVTSHIGKGPTKSKYMKKSEPI